VNQNNLAYIWSPVKLEQMKINPRFAIPFFMTFFSVTAVMYVKGRRNLDNTAFSGKIQKISYDEKSIPDITINNVIYNLTPLRKEFKEKVRVGDKIEKKKGISVYTVTNHETGKVINFEF
jgi:hypothetical protein